MMMLVKPETQNADKPLPANPTLPSDCEIDPRGMKTWISFFSRFESNSFCHLRLRSVRMFESTLWASRSIVLVAVIASVVVGVAMFFVATVDTIEHMKTMGNYLSSSLPTDQHEAMRTETITHVVEAIDGYLLGMVMIIFSFGLYELFISRIHPAEASDRSPQILLIHNLDDLKHRLAQVVLLILVVKFFERALSMSFEDPLDLLYFSVGILLTAAALYLSYRGGGGHDNNKASTEPAV
jgi:uncharacterized membrane protein YqhA